MNTKVNEGKLISGKEALIALANGEEVEYWCETDPSIQKRWTPIKSLSEYKLSYFLEDKPRFEFRLKPRTITINGIEVPVSFNGELGHKQYAYVLNTAIPDGYSHIKFYEGSAKPLACWICEDEIKQVVSALRSVFKPQ